MDASFILFSSFSILFRTFEMGWIIFSITVFIGHLLIDYVGNGVALLSP
ncbi:hypothetical protein GGGNBK_19575 [Sporosarcina sp. ANT_H38]